MIVTSALLELAKSREGSPWVEFLEGLSKGEDPQARVELLLESVEKYKDWRAVHEAQGLPSRVAVPRRFIVKGPPSPPLEVDWKAIEAQIWVNNLKIGDE